MGRLLIDTYIKEERTKRMSFRTRLIIKRDSESSIGRGAVLYSAHYRPEIAAITHATLSTAPFAELPDNEVWITEGYRPQRITGKRDLHTEMRALDFDCTRIIARSHGERYTLASRWAERIKKKLGPDYQVVLHGGETALHLHIELDP